ncbi:uncharacterized protein LOC131240822 [Magnolia sinica]|uniref:uncharacterized protein LOC131240822 n=1 Tax=Magnolia sinica TaxID=86752 RepID=UPI002659502E|nr:uncharacterized protein LOC131240822 [Magnolia sinica]
MAFANNIHCLSQYNHLDFSGVVLRTFIDVGSGRNANTGKDNGVNQSTDRGLTSTSSPVLQDIENKATIPTMRKMLPMKLRRAKHCLLSPTSIS